MPFEIDETQTELYQLGQLRGEQKGQQFGRTIEARHMLTSLLSRRFGAISSSIAERIGSADYEQVHRWIDRALDARSVGEVFDE
jgi:hypothetical protein